MLGLYHIEQMDAQRRKIMILLLWNLTNGSAAKTTETLWTNWTMLKSNTMASRLPRNVVLRRRFAQWINAMNPIWCISAWKLVTVETIDFNANSPTYCRHKVVFIISMLSVALFNWPGLLLIPTGISNYIHYNVWYKITYPFPNCTLEVWEWISNFTPHFTRYVITDPCWE